MKIFRRIRTSGSLLRTVPTHDGIERAENDPYGAHPISRSDRLDLGRVWNGLVLPKFEDASPAQRIAFARMALDALSPAERVEVLNASPDQKAAPLGWRKDATGAVVTDARRAATDGASMARATTTLIAGLNRQNADFWRELNSKPAA